MKKIVLFVMFALIIGGAVCMSYSTVWVLDAIGAMAMLAGAAIGTIKTVKRLAKRKRILALIALYLAVVLLIIAGSFQFSGTILIAILGTSALVVFGFLIGRE
ncbi:MAG: hypothetical protein P1P64_02900 [Treponemataceae bacterium]